MHLDAERAILPSIKIGAEVVKRYARAAVHDIRTWHPVNEWNGFKTGDLCGVKGTTNATWTFRHAAVDNETDDVRWITVYGGTGGPDGNQQFRSLTPDRIRELTAAEARKKVNKAAADAKKAAKAAEKPAELRKPRARKG